MVPLKITTYLVVIQITRLTLQFYNQVGFTPHQVDEGVI